MVMNGHLGQLPLLSMGLMTTKRDWQMKRIPSQRNNMIIIGRQKIILLYIVHGAYGFISVTKPEISPVPAIFRLLLIIHGLALAMYL